MPVFSAYNTNSFSVLSVNTAATHHNLNSLSKVWKKFFDNEDTRPLLQNTPDITVLEIHSPKVSLFRPKKNTRLFSLKSKLYADCAPRQIFMPGLFFWFNQRHSFLCNEVVKYTTKIAAISVSLSGVCLTPKQSFLVVSWQLKYLPNWLWNFHAFNQRPAEKGRLYKVLGRLLAVPTKRRMDQKNRCSACFHLLSS